MVPIDTCPKTHLLHAVEWDISLFSFDARAYMRNPITLQAMGVPIRLQGKHLAFLILGLRLRGS